MPTYDYVCDDCGYHFEEFQSITAEPMSNCPRCRGHVRRLIGSGNGFIFKGSGFYTTDYRSKSYNQTKQKEEGSVTKSSEKVNPVKADKDNTSKTMA